MNEFEWKAARREEARREMLRRAAAEQKTAAEWCAAWFDMAAPRAGGGAAMMREHETKFEMMGREYDALVRYELDPSDGHPLIDAVEIGRAFERYEEGKGMVKDRMSLDVTRMLYEGQLSALEDEIDGALKADAAAMDADRRAMEREERGLFRRSA
jgi:hypothetical protein